MTATRYTTDDLLAIVRQHGQWLLSEDGGSRADLSGADLRGADLRDADLRDADLSGADLRDADLRDADLSGADLSRAVLEDGVTWEEYVRDVVPAFLTAGGRALAEVATPETWACHSWSNCPTHVAFGADSIQAVPALHRWQAERFIRLFDAGLIPCPDAPATGGETR